MREDVNVYKKVNDLNPFNIDFLNWMDIMNRKIENQDPKFLLDALESLKNYYGKSLILQKSITINDETYSYEFGYMVPIGSQTKMKEAIIRFFIPSCDEPIDVFFKPLGKFHFDARRKEVQTRINIIRIIMMLNQINLAEDIEKAIDPVYKIYSDEIEIEREKRFRS